MIFKILLDKEFQVCGQLLRYKKRRMIALVRYAIILLNLSLNICLHSQKHKKSRVFGNSHEIL